MPETTDDATTNVGTAILFENDHVRVWEMVLQPGEQCDLHRHLYDHVLIYAEPGHMRGRLEGSDQDVVVEAEPGWVMYRAVGREGLSPHQIRNIGSEVTTHYIIELLGESASDVPEQPAFNDRGRFEFPDDDPDTG
jgi:beta-alanine degradation protein BauB